MKKISIASLFIVLLFSFAQAQVGKKNQSKPAVNVDQPPVAVQIKSAFGPLPDPTINFDLSRYPGYQRNLQVKRNASNAYRIQYIRMYRDEFYKTRGLPPQTRSFDNTEVREVKFINGLSPAELNKITFPQKPAHLKQIMDITALDLESSLGFHAYKELLNLQKTVNSLPKQKTAVGPSTADIEIAQLKVKVQEQEKLKIYLYVVGALAVLSMGFSVFIYQKR